MSRSACCGASCVTHPSSGSDTNQACGSCKVACWCVDVTLPAPLLLAIAVCSRPADGGFVSHLGGAPQADPQGGPLQWTDRCDGHWDWTDRQGDNPGRHLQGPARCATPALALSLQPYCVHHGVVCFSCRSRLAGVLICSVWTATAKNALVVSAGCCPVTLS